MLFPIREPQNYERLRRLSADEAIRCYLDGAFTIGEEPALVEAIQKGLMLPVNKDNIEQIILDCIDQESDVSTCKQMLISAKAKL